MMTSLSLIRPVGQRVLFSAANFLSEAAKVNASNPNLDIITTCPQDLEYNDGIKRARQGDTVAVAKMNGLAATLAKWGLADQTIFGAALDWQYKGPMYRIIDPAELDILLSGKPAISNREVHGGYRTDIINNPNYGKVGHLGKYRIQFKNKDKFDPVLHGEAGYPHTVTKNELEYEYHFYGHYTLNDVESIDHNDGDGWKAFPFAKKLSLMS